jgi:hypothetical protein
MLIEHHQRLFGGGLRKAWCQPLIPVSIALPAASGQPAAAGKKNFSF